MLITRDNREADVKNALDALILIYAAMGWDLVPNQLRGLVAGLDDDPEMVEVGHQHLRLHRYEPLVYEVLVSPRSLVNHVCHGPKGKTAPYTSLENTKRLAFYESIRNGKMGESMQRVFDYIKSQGVRGAIDYEIGMALYPPNADGRVPDSHKPLRTRLVEAKVVKPTCLRRLTGHGKKATVWVTNEFYDEAIHRGPAHMDTGEYNDKS